METSPKEETAMNERIAPHSDLNSIRISMDAGLSNIITGG